MNKLTKIKKNNNKQSRLILFINKLISNLNKNKALRRVIICFSTCNISC